jgi:hypothetical protein
LRRRLRCYLRSPPRCGKRSPVCGMKLEPVLARGGCFFNFRAAKPSAPPRSLSQGLTA